MSRRPNRLDEPTKTSAETKLLAAVVGTVLVVGLSLWAAVQLGARLNGTTPAEHEPPAVVVGVLSGDIPLTAASWTVLGIFAAAAAAIATVAARSARRRRRDSSRVDEAARYMGQGPDLDHLGARATTLKARELHVRDDVVAAGRVGVPVGLTERGRRRIFASWEDQLLVVAGPRTGKTTSLVVPALLEAPGAALVTSNKRDVVDATRALRAQAGPVWVFDPQQVALEAPTWWWDPLSYVVDDVTASQLAQHFASGSREPGAKVDAYFDPAGQDLVRGLLLAAALDGQPITTAYAWVTRPNDDRPADILDEHGYDMVAAQVRGVINAPDKQRGGIYGTAQQMLSCLTSRAVVQWVTPQPGRPAFHPSTFVESTGTLYSLSKEGKGSAGPLVTALTVAVTEAAEKRAAGLPGGRLDVPLLGVLDEAANVCRWADLPNLYSHFGSRGIVLATVLQSWSQGVEVWGRDGMRKLWSASNLALYLGGVREPEFLDELARLIGQRDVMRASVSHSRGGRSTSHHIQQQRILDVDELAALPRGRAVLFASGTPATLIRTQPWMTGPHADAVRASLAANDPAVPAPPQEARSS